MGTVRVGANILLHRPRGTGAIGRSELAHRAEEFDRGQGRSGKKPFGTRQHTQEVVQNAATQRRVNAEERPQKRGCREGRSPGRDRNSQVLRLHPRTKPHRGSCALGDPGAVAADSPRRSWSSCRQPKSVQARSCSRPLREAPSGSSPGPGGCSNEMLKVCLDNTEALHILISAAGDFGRLSVPDCIFQAFTMATMTAHQKPDRGIRGIATSTSFRRLVPKTSAKQFIVVVEQACAPFQFALSTRAATDCVGHAVRAVTVEYPEMSVLSIDGMGACDHVQRSSMLGQDARSACSATPLAFRQTDVCTGVDLLVGR